MARAIVRARTAPLALLPPIAPGREDVNVLAIDPGMVRLGWASWIDGKPSSGTRHLQDDAIFEVGQEFWRGQALLLYRQWLTHMLTSQPVDELWVEHPGTHHAFLDLWIITLYTLAEGICDVLNAKGGGICWRGDKPRGTFFSFACGNGNARKPVMLETVRTWGYDPRTQDESMAIAIRSYALAQPNS